MKKLGFWGILGLSVLISIIIPVLINWLLRTDSFFPQFQFGTANDWHAFFGNYAGAGMGVVFAILVSQYQVSENRKDLEKQIENERIERENDNKEVEYLRRLDRRMYIDFTWIQGGWNLLTNPDLNKIRIIQTPAYEYWDIRKNDLEMNVLQYGRFQVIGHSPLVFSVSISLFFRDNQDEVKELNYYLGKLTPEVVICIPTLSTEQPAQETGNYCRFRSLNIVRVQMEYKTVANEHLLYVSDFEQGLEYYELIEKNKRVRLQTTDIKNVTWIIPSALINSGDQNN